MIDKRNYEGTWLAKPPLILSIAPQFLIIFWFKILIIGVFAAVTVSAPPPEKFS